MEEYTLDHISKENGKWFAEIKKHNVDGTPVIEYTGELWGWNGMTYASLKCLLLEYYNIKIPAIRELKMIRRTSRKKVYSI